MTCSANAPYAADFKILIVVAAIIAPSQCVIADTEFGISLNNKWAYNTHSEHTQKFETTVEPQLDTTLGEDSQLTITGRLRHDTQNHIDIDQRSDSELREFFIETEFGGAFITLGKQQIVWGKSDGLKVLDVVNPEDWREFILDDFESARIPLWSANIEIPINNFDLQLLWLPDQRYHRFADNRDAFRLTSPTRAPQAPPGIAVDILPETKPDNTIQDADWGMRLSTFWKGWDLSVNYLYHYDDTPVLYRSLTMTGNGALATIAPHFERSHLIGGSFSTAIDDITLRGELGYSTDKYISTNDVADIDGVMNTSDLTYVLGLDWFGLDDTFISTQLFQSHLLDHHPGVIREQTETNVTLLIRRDFLNETLTTEVLALRSLDLDDGLIRPKLTYQFNDEISLSLSGDIFYGNKQGLFGQFDKQDRLMTTIEISI